MLRCKNCGKSAARIASKGALQKLSNTLAPLAGVIAVAAAKAGPSAPGAMMRVAKAATKDTKSLVIGAGLTLAVGAIGNGIKYWLDRKAMNDKKYVYCPECGHYEPMP